MIGTYNEPLNGYGWNTDAFGRKTYTVAGNHWDDPPACEGWEYHFIARHGSYTRYTYKPVT